MFSKLSVVLLSIFWPLLVAAQQAGLASSQCNNFNSDFQLSANQIQVAGIDNDTAHAINVIIQYEQSNWAHAAVDQDDFYRVPANSTNAPAGSLLKVEIDANTSLYTLPPNTALSRILFQTETLNETLAPASAYVLWPYSPRTQPNGRYQTVVFAHGTSGFFPNCAPSNYRNLLYQFSAPFTLALQGYVVVAPDFLGLGVGRDSTGKPITHLQLSATQNANDLFYSIQAAQSAFKTLSRQFVVVGHSEGGGAAWAAAERQAVNPVQGYLGAVLGSPVTNFLDIARLYGSAADGAVFALLPALQALYPTFQLSSLLTTAGQKIYQLLSSIQGCNSATSLLTSLPNLVISSNWTESYYVNAYQNLSAVGGNKISGPVLILQGELDPAVPIPITTAAVNATCQQYPESQLEYLTFANVTHVPVMYAAQRTWLNWIEDRFQGTNVSEGCKIQNTSSSRPYMYYQSDINWFLEYAAQPGYETA